MQDYVDWHYRGWFNVNFEAFKGTFRPVIKMTIDFWKLKLHSLKCDDSVYFVRIESPYTTVH